MKDLQPVKDANRPAISAKSLIQSDSFRAAVQEALPKHINPKHLVRLATTAFEKTPELKSCTNESIVNCLMDCAAFGLEPDGRRAHLIPYGRTCKLIVDYKGMVDILMRSGLARRIHADVVCRNDKFENNLGEVTCHSIDYSQPRGEVYAAYAMVELKTGARQCQVMQKDEIDAIRAQSKSGGSGQWVTHYNEMAKKTVFKRLCKWLSLTPELEQLLGQDVPPPVLETRFSDCAPPPRDFPEDFGTGTTVEPVPADRNS